MHRNTNVRVFDPKIRMNLKERSIALIRRSGGVATFRCGNLERGGYIADKFFDVLVTDKLFNELWEFLSKRR